VHTPLHTHIWTVHQEILLTYGDTYMRSYMTHLMHSLHTIIQYHIHETKKRHIWNVQAEIKHGMRYMKKKQNIFSNRYAVWLAHFIGINWQGVTSEAYELHYRDFTC
jgi:hypothetical protein